MKISGKLPIKKMSKPSKSPLKQEEQWKPLDWKNSASNSLDTWKLILPLLSLKDIHSLSQAGPMFQMIVDWHFATGSGIIDGESLKRLPPMENTEFYSFIGRSVTRIVLDTMEAGLLVTLFPHFPHLRELTLRNVVIRQRDIKGFPVKLRSLELNNCRANQYFVEKWLEGLSGTLETLCLIHVDEEINNAGSRPINVNREFDFPELEKLSVASKNGYYGQNRTLRCPRLDHFSFDIPNGDLLDATLAQLADCCSDTLTTLVLRNCPQGEFDFMEKFPNLTNLTILSPIDDTEKWSEIKELRSELETFNCSFSAAPIDHLSDDNLLEIFGHLNTDDFIALTHVNRRLRRLVFDSVYPTKWITVAVGKERYPLNKCLEIYREMGQRVRKLSLKGKADATVEIFAHLQFPNLRVLFVHQPKLDGVEGIPAELEELYLHQVVPRNQLNFLLYRVAPHIKRLYLDFQTTFPLASLQMPNLDEIRIATTAAALEELLDENENLEKVHAKIHSSYENWSISETFEGLAHLSVLTVDLTNWTGQVGTETVSAEDKILPGLKELTILNAPNNHVSQKNAVRQFLWLICNANLSSLDINYFYLDEIKTFKGLTNLTIHLDLVANVVELLEELPKLRVLQLDRKVTFSEGMRLVAYLERNERQLHVNKQLLASSADLLKVGYSFFRDE